jgi:hypothetical protein
MKKTLRTLAVVLIIIILVGIAWTGYQEGYSWGLYRGYTEGYEASVKSFPRLELDDVTFTQNGMSIYFSQMTIVGEQHIIDKIKNLPNMEGIISIKQGVKWSEFAPGAERR